MENNSKEELREAQNELSNLVKSPGWARLLRFAKEQAEVRLDSFLNQPLRDLGAALEQEYRKGEIAGMNLLTQLPVILLANIETDLKRGPTNE